MKVSVKNQSKCEKILSIEFPQERVRAEFNKAYQEIAKKAKIPGFRPGKAPKEVLELHYSENAKEAVLQNLVEEGTQEAVKQEKLEPIYYPSVNKVNFEGENLSFDALIEVRPEIKLASYKGLKAKRGEVKVIDKEIEDSLERIRESFAKFIPIEDRAVGEGDFMICDIESEIDGKKTEPRKDDWFEVNSNKAHKDLVAGVGGMKPDETRVVDVKFPKDYGVKEQAGKTAKFTVHLKEIKKRELPEINDEWAKGLGEVASVDDLKKRIREDLNRQKEQSEDYRFENELLDALLKEARLDLPQGAVERRLVSLIKNAKERMKQQGVADEEISKSDPKLREDLRAEAEKQLKLRFVFEEIAQLEKIKVEETDLNEHYEKLATNSKVDVEQVKQYYEKSGEQKENLINQVATEKILKVLKDNAKA